MKEFMLSLCIAMLLYSACFLRVRTRVWCAVRLVLLACVLTRAVVTWRKL